MKKELLLVFTCTLLPWTALAHGAGTSFEKEVNGKLIDIGYDIPFDTSESTLMDFAIFEMKAGEITRLADFTAVRIQIQSGSLVQLDRTLEKPDFGKIYTEFRPEKSGNWVMRTEYFQGATVIAVAEFPLSITDTPADYKIPVSFMFTFIIAGLACIASFSFRPSYKQHV